MDHLSKAQAVELRHGLLTIKIETTLADSLYRRKEGDGISVDCCYSVTLPDEYRIADIGTPFATVTLTGADEYCNWHSLFTAQFAVINSQNGDSCTDSVLDAIAGLLSQFDCIVIKQLTCNSFRIALQNILSANDLAMMQFGRMQQALRDQIRLTPKIISVSPS